ncbi:MAG: anti-sigma factor [Methylobacteriaceae bacterium]|nr:anti-sigma factor [Methylobacteriaceae bacterium]
MNGDLENLAGEYVLGTLDGAERVEFERRLATEPNAREAVARWHERLAPLAETIEPVTPPARVWQGIEARLEAPRERKVVPFEAVEKMRRKIWFWRSASAAAAALAAALAFFVIDRELLPPSREGKSYVAVVNRGGETPALIIRVDTASHTVYVRPLAAEAPPDRSLELWYINAGQAPKSLGLVQTAPARVPLPDDLARNKVTLAVTSEPPGGSPTGAPTGPIVYSGELFAE